MSLNRWIVLKGILKEQDKDSFDRINRIDRIMIFQRQAGCLPLISSAPGGDLFFPQPSTLNLQPGQRPPHLGQWGQRKSYKSFFNRPLPMVA
jgi:hypothetical protein